MPNSEAANVTWRKPDGQPIACIEKIKVLNENRAELQQMIRDAIEDALLLGCSEAQIRAVLHAIIDDVAPAFPELKE